MPDFFYPLNSQIFLTLCTPRFFFFLALPRFFFTQSNITKAILALVDGLPGEDLADPDGVVVVRVSKLLKVLEYVMSPAELKAITGK